MYNEKEKTDIQASLKKLLDLDVISLAEYEEKLEFLSNYHEEQDQEEEPADSEKGEVLVDVKNFTKKYPGTEKPAVQNLTFQIRKGQFHAFIGANGAGKTTTMKALVGAYAKWDGEIKINGIDNQKVEAKEKIGYVPEKAVFPKSFTSKEYLESMAKLAGLTKSEAKKFAKEKLKEFKMERLANKTPELFSSGQKKKILCAQALCHNPDVLILDEPAANLDPIARIELFDLLKKVQNEGKAIFISSHILAEVGKYANYATILDGGKIVYSGPVRHNSDLERLYTKYVLIGSVHTSAQAEAEQAEALPDKQGLFGKIKAKFSKSDEAPTSTPSPTEIQSDVPEEDAQSTDQQNDQPSPEA